MNLERREFATRNVLHQATEVRDLARYSAIRSIVEAMELSTDSLLRFEDQEESLV